MKHAEFEIGKDFWCGGAQWRTTDIGTRVVVAILIDRIQIQTEMARMLKKLIGSEAEAEGWLNGPPYAVQETVFDEDDMTVCSKKPKGEE